MIRIRRVSADAGGLAADTRALPSEAAARAAAPAEIIRDFADPYLELVRLLREASEIEHALLVQYLYAAYSLKPQYVAAGPGHLRASRPTCSASRSRRCNISRRNRMLVDLDAAPNLVRQDFPYEPDIYPFPLNLEPLTRESVAKYVYTEASAAALDRDDPSNSDPATQAFLDQLDAALGEVEPNHLGSLYGTIIARTHEVIAAAIPGLPDLSGWLTILDAIKGEGENGALRVLPVGVPRHAQRVHRASGRLVVAAFGPGLPSIELPLNPSAFEGHPNQITERRTAAHRLAEQPALLAGAGSARSRLPRGRRHRDRSGGEPHGPGAQPARSTPRRAGRRAAVRPAEHGLQPGPRRGGLGAGAASAGRRDRGRHCGARRRTAAGPRVDRARPDTGRD